MSNRGNDVKHSLVRSISILMVAAWPIAAQQFPVARDGGPPPAEIRVDHEILVDNQRLQYIFLDLLHDTGLRGGFVEMAKCSNLPKGRLKIKQGVTVKQAMNALVAANPGYQWELRDNVVNLMPRGAAPLLHTRIAKFQKDATDREIGAILQDVLNLPEVKRHVASLGLKPGISGIGLWGGEEHPIPKKPVPVHVDLENVSLQDAFNEILLASPKGAWIYHESDCNGEKTFSVEALTDY